MERGDLDLLEHNEIAQEVVQCQCDSDEFGNRIVSSLQTLEKITLSGQKSGTKFGPDDLQQLRCVTSKILQYLQTQDKTQRDIIIKSSSYVDLVLNVLENVNDTCTEHNLVLVLSELIGKSQTSKRVSTLVSHGATHVLFQILVLQAKESTCSEELLITIHQVLAKLGHKDRKFGVKARLSQALGVTLGLLKSFSTNPKLLQPVVHVLKLYAANAVNASYLGKNGAVSYLFKIISVCGRRHLSLSKYAFDTLALLVKSKSNAARAIGQGGVPMLLNNFYDWHRVDSKNRHVTLRKSVLSVLKNITNLQSGRKSLMDADGIRVLYTTCQESVDCRESESLILMASLIMRKCLPKNRLPLSNLRSPISCHLPQSDFHVPDPGEGQVMDSDAENGYESSVDNDDDISSDDDGDAHKLESDEEPSNSGNKPPCRRTSEDLLMYKKFFPELYEFDVILEEEVALASSQSAIVIPTALSDLNNFECLPQARPTLRYTTSLTNTPTAGLNEDYCSSALEKLRLDGIRNRNIDFDSEFFKNTQSRPQHKDFVSESMFDVPSISHGPSAVNLKTGLSVFSLDIPPSLQVIKPIPPIQPNRSPRVKRKTAKVAKVREKKRTKPKEDDWCSFDPLQSLSVVSYSRETGPEDDGCDEDNDETSNNFDSEEARFIAARYDNPEIYADIAARTKSVGRFNKLAYPDMYGHVPPPYKESLYEKRFGMQRQKIFEDIDRFINPEQTIDRTVYDLDSIVNTAGHTYSASYSTFTNRDEIRVARHEETTEHLKFNSQFECGNLRKVIQIRKYEYDLILNPDTNTNHHHQWFYFEVSNMEAGIKYRFNIVNCEKLNSQFNFGMKPVMFSVAESMQGRPYWTRTGSEICYYKNHFVRSTQTTGGVKGKTYYTTTFTVTFKHEKDVCYLAYHYPYSYSMLQYHLHKLEESYDSNLIYLRKETLCETIGGNPVPLLTITSHPSTYDREGIEQLKNRPYMFLSARVHPGESNSSWVMKGTISYLLSNKSSAQTLRDQYIFKIVPMLNPDGVINGTHRCSLVAEDLNRRWLCPCPKLHPTIYHTKGLLQYMNSIAKSPMVFCDFHGHSRKKNVFLYGCSPSLSWMTEDATNPAFLNNKMEDTSYKTLPKVLANIAPSFSLNNCSFMVEKAKESTARVVVWRQLGVVRSYTMESSYCGCDQGPYKGYHISTRELEEMGRKFCEALLKVKSRPSKVTLTSPLIDGAEGDMFSMGPAPLQEYAELVQRSQDDLTRLERPHRMDDPTHFSRMHILDEQLHTSRPQRPDDLCGRPHRIDEISHQTDDLNLIGRPSSKRSGRGDVESILDSDFGGKLSDEALVGDIVSYGHDADSSTDSDICDLRPDSDLDDEVDDEVNEARVDVSTPDL